MLPTLIRMNSTIPNPQTAQPFTARTRTHRPHAACLLSAAALLLAPGLRAQPDAPKPAPAAEEDAQPKAHSVRLKFVPAPADPARGNGANWSELHHFADDDPDVLMVMAHAGIGDSFPVQEKDQPKVMDVKIVSGNDDELELSFAPTEKPYPNDSVPKTMKVRRDKTGSILFRGYRYLFSYPSVNIASDAKTTTDTPMLIVNRIPLNSAFATTTPAGTLLYSLRFSDHYNEGRPGALESSLVVAFPRDSIVMSPSAENVRLPSFEVRNMKLKELAKTIEFLSEGKLTVEVVEKESDMPGNIWRIGGSRTLTAATGTINLKMRSVAAPHLFSDAKKVERMMKDATAMEDRRLNLIANSGSVVNGQLPRVSRTEIEPLPGQQVFVLIGTEEGVAGMESFIKAAEQLATDDDAKKLALNMADDARHEQEFAAKRAGEEAKIKVAKQREAEEAAAKDALAAAIAPKIHAVAAPHLFASKERLERFTDEAKEMQSSWEALHQFLMKEAGINKLPGRMAGGINIQPRPGQKIFMLLGSEEGIAGMESLIKAAEQLAADEDAKILALKMADEARDAAEKAEALRKKDLDDKYRKGTPQNP